jgi:hypothetical protein
MSIELKTTDEFTLRNDMLTEEDQNNLQEFVHAFASKFDLNFNKDIRLSIRTKHNEDGSNLLIKVRETDTYVIDSRQLDLFKEPPKAVAEKNNKQLKKDHGNVIDLTEQEKQIVKD